MSTYMFMIGEGGDPLLDALSSVKMGVRVIEHRYTARCTDSAHLNRFAMCSTKVTNLYHRNTCDERAYKIRKYPVRTRPLQSKISPT